MTEYRFTTLEIARVCHEANRAMQFLLDDPAPSPSWDQAPQWQRESALVGVTAAQEGATPAQLHQSWCDEKTAAGWTYGPEKNGNLLEHPCLVPYADLPPEQRAKDTVFHAIVRALSAPTATVQRDPNEQTRYEKAKARFFTASEHPPVVALRDQIIGLGMLIDEHVPPGRNQSLALTALEDVQMRGNRGIFAPEGLR